MVHGEHMADPNGHCQACGRPCPEDARTCPHCEENPVSWNQKVQDQDAIWRGLGWNDDQIRKAGDDLFGGYKAQGMTEEFQKELEDQAVKKALGE
jgi:predicted nucleic acid-binding Zn ribbon protein